MTFDRPPVSYRPALKTRRLFLRRPDLSDRDSIVSIVGDWNVARNLSRVPHPYGPTDAGFFLEEIVPNEWAWAITISGSRELVGAIGLTPDTNANTAELGYWLSPSLSNKGIVTEAARAVVAFGFDTLRFPPPHCRLFRAQSGIRSRAGKAGICPDRLGATTMPGNQYARTVGQHASVRYREGVSPALPRQTRDRKQILVFAERRARQLYRINWRTKSTSPVWRARFRRSDCRMPRTCAKQRSKSSFTTT